MAGAAAVGPPVRGGGGGRDRVLLGTRWSHEIPSAVALPRGPPQRRRCRLPGEFTRPPGGPGVYQDVRDDADVCAGAGVADEPERHNPVFG